MLAYLNNDLICFANMRHDMSVIKSFSVGNGDLFYINHGSDNFTIIDCCYRDDNQRDLTAQSSLQSCNEENGLV